MKVHATRDRKRAPSSRETQLRREKPARAQGSAGQTELRVVPNGERPARILVVEDSSTQASATQAFLQSVGFEVEVAPDGQAGWDRLVQESFDLILSDVMMPCLSGYELCRRIKDTPETRGLPVILLTELSDTDSILRGLKHGADSYVIKPYDETCLEQRVNRLLRKYSRGGGAPGGEDAARIAAGASPVLPENQTDRMLDYFAATLDDFVRTREREHEGRDSDSSRIASALVRVGGDLLAAGGSSQTMERVCRLTIELLGCDASYTYLLRPERKTCAPVAAVGVKPEDWDLLRAMEIPVANLKPLLGQLEIEGIVQMDSERRTVGGDGIPHSAVDLYILLRSGNETIGFQVAAYRHRASSWVARRKDQIVRSFMPIAALAVNNARLGEELQRANRVKADFVNVVSHELRTPLHVILGYSELLLSGALGTLSGEQQESLHRMHTSASALSDLIGNILDVRRIRDGHLPIRVTATHIAELAAELERELDPYPRPRGLELQWEVEPGLPVVFTDPGKLRVVWKNLVTNAIKFTEAGVVRVGVHANDGGIDFTVSDTGAGIAPDVLPIIFECFRQADSSATRPAGGTGIGLYLVRELLSQLGGRIDVTSAVGRGSTFRAWIPRRCESTDAREAGAGPTLAQFPGG